MRDIEFWFDFASTYSYLTAARIEELALTKNLKILYRPFLLGPIFNEQGWNNSPFVIYPAKGEYMWKDVARQAAKYGLKFQRPSQFPRNGLLPARVATAAENEAWLPRFVQRVFDAEFTKDADISSPQVVAEILSDLKVDPDTWLTKAADGQTKLALRARTEEAKAKSVFGAPTFFIGREMFWGDDRLEDALYSFKC